jgi:hypothetical protein
MNPSAELCSLTHDVVGRVLFTTDLSTEAAVLVRPSGGCDAATLYASRPPKAA